MKVTEDEVKAYYEANKADYVQPEERETSHILIAVPAAEGEGSAASPPRPIGMPPRLEAEKMRSEIQNGADFAAEAEQILR